jgi:alkaline phosphatase D
MTTQHDRSRRELLRLLGSAAALVPLRLLRAAPELRVADDPFVLGVASGCPTHNGIVLWTRLILADALVANDIAIPVHWEIASDASMQQVMQSGTEQATADWAHSIHVEISALQPDREYWYRFTAAGHQSIVGRTRTAPAPGASRKKLRFTVASCQKYENGYYVAYRHMLDDTLDFVVHVGDYIYEGTGGNDLIRGDGTDEAITLDQYRARYALYKRDADLRAAHAAYPWLVTWDDHEVANDYGGDASLEQSGAEFLLRRAAAYRAYYEHMPLPQRSKPIGSDLALYGQYSFGSLLSIQMLDSRQYRSYRACVNERSDIGARCAELYDPQRSKLGMQQEAWLTQSLKKNRARWNVLAQGTPMAHMNLDSGGKRAYSRDAWDGYQAARQRLLDTIATQHVRNPVVIDGDHHAFLVAKLNRQAHRVDTPVLASEFTTTSISSPLYPQPLLDTRRRNNPNLLLADSHRHGYLLMELTNQQLQTQLITVDTVTRTDARRSVLASYIVPNGKPGPIIT